MNKHIATEYTEITESAATLYREAIFSVISVISVAK